MNNQIQKTTGLRQIGISFQEELPFEEWKAIGERFGEATKQFSWALGDWLVYGRDKFRKRISHELIVEAEKMTGVDRASLLSLATVCRRIPIEQRIPSLSFEHHQTIAIKVKDEENRKNWLSFLASQDKVPSKKLLSLSIVNSEDDPKIITIDDYRKKKIKFGQKTHVVPLRSLLSFLRANKDEMNEMEKLSFLADFEQVEKIVEEMRTNAARGGK